MAVGTTKGASGASDVVGAVQRAELAAPGDRPQQRTNELSALLAEARSSRVLVERLAADIAERSGGRVTGPARLKDPGRAAEKIANECGHRPELLLDGVAIAIEYPTLAALRAGVAALDATTHGTTRRVRNRFEKGRPNGYADVNVNAELPNRHICELQLHVAPMREAKTLEQGLYGIRRVLECSSDPAAASVLAALEGASAAIYGYAHRAVVEERALTTEEVGAIFGLVDQARALA